MSQYLLRRGLGATSPYASQVQSLAPSYGIPPSLALAVMQKESSGDPNAISPVGAQGLFQLMPATAASLGVSDPFNPTQNIQGGLKYLQQLYNQYGDWNEALIAYNEGPGNLAKSGVFPSSQSYADSILAASGISDSSGSSDSLDTGSPVASADLFDSLDAGTVAGISVGTLAIVGAGIIGLLVLIQART